MGEGRDGAEEEDADGRSWAGRGRGRRRRPRRDVEGRAGGSNGEKGEEEAGELGGGVEAGVGLEGVGVRARDDGGALGRGREEHGEAPDGG